jgi:hypothetical protein
MDGDDSNFEVVEWPGWFDGGDCECRDLHAGFTYALLEGWRQILRFPPAILWLYMNPSRLCMEFSGLIVLVPVLSQVLKLSSSGALLNIAVLSYLHDLYHR